MRIVLIRHAESWGDLGFFDLSNRLDGLTPAGLENARRVAADLGARERDVAAVFSSPLERAKETAAVFGAALNKQVIEVSEFAEVNMGRWEGKSQQEVRENFPEDVAAFYRAPEAFQFPDGETMTAFLNRIAVGLQRALDVSGNQTPVIVTHWVVIAFLTCRALNRPLGEFLTYSVPNCGVTVLELEGW